jgi:hypothetical protein
VTSQNLSQGSSVWRGPPQPAGGALSAQVEALSARAALLTQQDSIDSIVLADQAHPMLPADPLVRATPGREHRIQTQFS